jgi:hypothetical protein
LLWSQFKGLKALSEGESALMQSFVASHVIDARVVHSFIGKAIEVVGWCLSVGVVLIKGAWLDDLQSTKVGTWDGSTFEATSLGVSASPSGEGNANGSNGHFYSTSLQLMRWPLRLSTTNPRPCNMTRLL